MIITYRTSIERHKLTIELSPCRNAQLDTNRVQIERRIATSLLLVAAVCVLPCGSAIAQDREWIVVPYLWGADTSVDVLVRNDPAFGGDLDFSDLVDKLDVALQLHVETRRNHFGMLFLLCPGALRSRPTQR